MISYHKYVSNGGSIYKAYLKGLYRLRRYEYYLGAEMMGGRNESKKLALTALTKASNKLVMTAVRELALRPDSDNSKHWI